jgi:RNA polymerase sigma-70 factor (ECF subfamily)
MDKDLYRHADFLRGIARGLLREVHAADDVVHDAYASVLARGGVFSRAYLAATVRHMAFKWLRSRKRVARREQEAARPVATPPSGEPGDLAGQAELQRRVATAVAELDPIYRDALLLRYYQGLEPAEIARRTGQPVGTVKTRLRRGLQTLRARLDAEHKGDTRQWALGLAGALLAYAPEAAAAAVGIPVGVKVAAAVIAAGGVTLVAWHELRKPPPEPPRHVVVATSTRANDLDDRIDPEAAPEDPAHKEEASAGPPSTLRWKITPGTHGLPAPGTELRLLWDKPARPPIPGPRARIEEDTVVVEGMREESGNAFAITPGGSMAWVRWNRAAKGWVNEVTFYPPRTVRVRIVERGGRPLAGAPVRVKQSYTPRGDARTDASGVVVFERLFGPTLDAFLGRDDELGTYWRWLGSVDLDRSDGDIDAVVEPLEPFTIHVADSCFLEPPPKVGLYRATAVELSVDRAAGRIAFRARRLGPGHPLRATVEFRGLAPVTLILEGNEAVCEVPVQASISGTVVLPPDGEVRLTLDIARAGGGAQRRHVRLVRRPEEGDPPRYEVSGLAPGAYRLYDALSGRTLAPFVLHPQERLELASLDLSRCVWVEGRVEPTPTGGMPSFVRVRFPNEHGLGGQRQFPDGLVNEGRFKVRLPGDRETMLELESPTLVASPVRVGDARESVVIRARAGARAVYELTLPDDPEDPKSLYHPTAQLRQGERVFYRPIEIDRKLGRATIAGLRPGRYDTVRLRIGTWPTTVLRNVTIGAGANALGRLAIARGSRVRVHIRVPRGQGPPRLTVGAVSLDDAQEFRHVNPLAMEVVTLPGLGQGRWKLNMHVMQSIPERFNFEREIEVDGETDLDIELDLRR